METILQKLKESKTSLDKAGYINLTYMCMAGSQTDQRRPASKIRDWHSKKVTIEFLGLWEGLYNKNFNQDEFEKIRSSEKYVQLSIKQWVEKTNAIGLYTAANGALGRGNIFAHKDIAYDFGLSSIPEFKYAFFTGDFKGTDKFFYPLSVIRSNHNINRKEIFAKFNGHCAYCGCKLNKDTFNVDHIMPKVVFGQHLNDESKIPYFLKHLKIEDVNHPDNIFPACIECNRDKRYKDLETWRMTRPGAPFFYFETLKPDTDGN